MAQRIEMFGESNFSNNAAKVIISLHLLSSWPN
jgi:hypothetical protein